MDDITTLQTLGEDARADLQLITTLRWSPHQDKETLFIPEAKNGTPAISQASLMNPNELLPYHLTRLTNAAKDLGFTAAYSLLKGQKPLDQRPGLCLLLEAIRSSIKDSTLLNRVRITIDCEGTITTISTPLSEPTPFILVPKPNLAGPDQFSLCSTTTSILYISPKPLTPSPLTTHKTTHRAPYIAARAALDIESASPKSAEVLLANMRGEIMEASLSSVYFLRGGKWITPSLSTGCNAGVTRSFALTYGYCMEGIIMIDELVDQERVWLSNAVRGFWAAKLELGKEMRGK